MGRGNDPYETLVTLAGWLWYRLARGAQWFRHDELLGIDDLEHLGGMEQAAKKARNRAFNGLEEFGIVVEWDPAIVDPSNSEAGAYRISPQRLSDREQRVLADIAFQVAFEDWDARINGMVPGAFLEGGGETVLLRSEPLLDDVATALTEKRCIRLLYDDREWRTIQPIHLVVLKGRWYLVGFDLAKNEVRNYRLSRGEEVKQSDEAWDDQRADIDIEAHVVRLSHPELYGDGPVLDFEVAVEPGVASRAERILPVVGQVDTRPDDRIVYRCQASNIEHFVASVFALRSRAEVLSPPRVRQVIIDHLESTIEALS